MTKTVAYYKLVITWQGREVLVATRKTLQEAQDYCHNMANIKAVPVYCN